MSPHDIAIRLREWMNRERITAAEVRRGLEVIEAGALRIAHPAPKKIKPGPPEIMECRA